MSNDQQVDEWKLEQGLAGHELPALDQSGEQSSSIVVTSSKDKLCQREPYLPQYNGLVGQDDQKMKAIAGLDHDKAFAEERAGWRGYIEWEDYPAKKALANKVMLAHKFPPPPEFQLAPVPDAMPVMEGVRWKLWHKAIGGALKAMPEESWLRVVQEKHPDMLHLLEFPYNGESPKKWTTSKAIPESSLHFVRNHGGIPDIAADKWDLQLDGLVNKPQTFTLADLQDQTRFKRVKKVVTIQCSGTRRFEQIALYAGEGDEMINAPWAEGAIGTAEWEGVTLKSVIDACGGMAKGGKHLEFSGADSYVKQNNLMNYLVSVPWSKVKSEEVLLAWNMNGKPLPKIHGFPVRAVVYGYIGARSVKWLYRIRAISKPSRAPVQAKEYLYFNGQVGKHNQVPTAGINIQEMPVSSAFMSPWTKQVVIHNGEIEFKGWAYSGGGRWPERVEVSVDGGHTWYACPVHNMSKKRKWAWRTWHMKVPVDAEGWLEALCRTWDNSLNTQPLEVRSAWNWGLHVTSSCHRIKIFSVNKSHPSTAARLKAFEDHNVPFTPITRPTEFQQQSPEEYEKYWDSVDPRDADSTDEED